MEKVEFTMSDFIDQSVPIIKTIPIEWNNHAKMIEEIAKSYEPNFDLTDTNKIIFRLLLLYFSGNPDFDSELMKITGVQGSRNKGLLLFGSVGSGKSLILFKVFRRYVTNILKQNTYQALEYIDILDNAMVDPQYLSGFGFQKPTATGRDLTWTVLIDDFLSTNSSINYYGNKIEVADTLIMNRYQAYDRVRKLTHITTNFEPAQMKEFLDQRTISRLSEMCNVIELTGDDWRRK